MDAKQVVQSYWEAMNTNDFEKASQWLAEDYECIWHQSSECIRGRENFVQINMNYPANGRWVFEINQIVVEANTVVTDVSVTDGKIHARVITFSTVGNGLITRQVEYWPDDYPAPEWRKQWIEPLDSN